MKKLLLVVLVLFGLQTQAQQSAPYFCCDSITYWTDQSQGFNIGLDTTNIIHNPDSIDVLWQVCNSSQCYTGTGMYAYFGQVMTSDTLKVCYDIYLYTSNTVNWVLFSMQGNPLSINELTFNRTNDGKIYDLLGRELTEIPTGKLYIRNQKLYITR